MNSFSTFTTLLVIGALSIANFANCLPSQEPYSANSIGGGSSWSSGPPNCARSEVYSRCEANPMCQKTCDNYNGPIACTRSGALVANMCYPGCVCKEGFVRVAPGDQCIPIDKCQGRVKH